jgi:hypothetical protein
VPANESGVVLDETGCGRVVLNLEAGQKRPLQFLQVLDVPLTNEAATFDAAVAAAPSTAASLGATSAGEETSYRYKTRVIWVWKGRETGLQMQQMSSGRAYYHLKACSLMYAKLLPVEYIEIQGIIRDIEVVEDID